MRERQEAPLTNHSNGSRAIEKVNKISGIYNYAGSFLPFKSKLQAHI